MKIKTKDILPEDLSRHELLSMIAKADVKVAREIARTFSGRRIYFPQWESVQRRARDREITDLRVMLKLPGEIAREFRFNYRGQDLYKILIKMIKNQPLF